MIQIIQLMEKRPITSTIIFTVLLSTISTFTYDKYRDWKDAAVPAIDMSDIRISPESNHLFLKGDDLIPTSQELMEYLRDDVRTAFIGLGKILTYKTYYDYLKVNKKNIVIFNTDKKDFMSSLNDILQILKTKNPTENDKEKFFDIVWRNYNRIWSSFNLLISSGLMNLEYFETIHNGK